jgi:hypothetical protein
VQSLLSFKADIPVSGPSNKKHASTGKGKCAGTGTGTTNANADYADINREGVAEWLALPNRDRRVAGLSLAFARKL